MLSLIQQLFAYSSQVIKKGKQNNTVLNITTSTVCLEITAATLS